MEETIKEAPPPANAYAGGGVRHSLFLMLPYGRSPAVKGYEKSAADERERRHKEHE